MGKRAANALSQCSEVGMLSRKEAFKMSNLQQTAFKEGDSVVLLHPVNGVPAGAHGIVKRGFAGLLGVHFPEWNKPGIVYLEASGTWVVDLCELAE